MPICQCGVELVGRRRKCDDCKAGRVRDRAPEADSVEVSTVPEGLCDRGAELWRSLGRERGTADGEVALEACRMADRLDELDRLIAGKGVLNLLQFRLGLDLVDEVEDVRRVEVEVKISGVLGEARQQQRTFATLLEVLGMKPAADSPKPAATERPPAAHPLDEVRRRREQRGQK